jgi:outer membrane protein assembly factor BamB
VSRRPLPLVALLATALFAAPRPATAQEIEVGRPYRVADSGEATRHIDEYERHRDAGRWEQAVAALDRLLAIPPERGLVVRVDGPGPLRFEGVEIAARRLFESLPPEGVAAWEERFRQDAEDLVLRGLRKRRPDDLRAAARRFPARDVRRRCHEALASLALARGHFGAATHELRALLALAEGNEERALVLARIAFARAQLGDRNGVDRVAELAADLRNVVVPGPEGGEPLSGFVERMQRAAGSAAGPGMGRPQFSGNEHGTAIYESPPTPESRARWQLAIGYQEGIETANDSRFPWRPPRQRRHRPVVPVVSRGVVYVNTGLHLRAVDLSSGHVIWQRGTRQRAAEWRDNFLAVHTAAVEGDAVYAALATRADAPAMQRKFYGRIIVYRLPHRSLACYDARSGEIVWSHDDEHLADHPDAEEISKESVASPPLIVGDDLLVATWTFDSSFDVRLVCFDRHTGRTRWRRSLVQGQQELNLFGRPVKELATTALAELDGVVYFATGLGVAAGVHVADGRIAWLSAYPQTPVPMSEFWYETRERSITWRPSPVAATRRGVLMAPLESPYLLSFEPRDGRVRWRVPHSHSPFDHDHFLGVLGDRAFLLGDRLTAFDLETGKRSWKDRNAGRVLTLDQEETRATGAGILTERGVVVPSRDCIQLLSAEDGRSLEQSPLPDGGARSPGGNLVSADGALLVVSRGDMSAHYRFEDRRDRLLARIAREPDDPRLRLEVGEIFRGAGRLDDAISSFEVGMSQLEGLAPRAREVLEGPLRSALFAAYAERAEEARRAGDHVSAARALQRAVEVTHDRGDAVRALLALDDVGTVVEARAALQRIRDEYPNVHVTLGGLGRVHAGALATLRLGERHLAAGETDEAISLWIDLLEQNPDADLGRSDVRGAVAEKIDVARRLDAGRVDELVRRRARRAFDAARSARDPAALDRVARTYPDPRTQADAALLAADLHLNRDDARAAVAILRTLLARPIEERDRALALWRLAAAYRALEETAAERMTLQRLGRDHADVEVDGRPASEQAAELLADPRLAAPRADLPNPKPPLELRWDSDSTASAPQLIALRGRIPDALEGHLLAMRASVMELLDESTGRPVWRTPTDLDWRLVIAADDAIVVVGDVRGPGASDVMVRSFGASDGDARWSRRLDGSFRAAASGLGALYVMHSERGGQGGAQHALTALDTATGEVLAARDFSGAMLPDLVVAEDAVLAFRSGADTEEPPRTVLTLDATTLSLRGTTPLDDLTFDNPAVHPPGAGVVVTLSDASTLVAVDVATGTEAWRWRLSESEVKTFHAVEEGVIVSDTVDRLVRLDAESGEATWTLDLSEDGGLGWQGLAVADGMIVATLVPPGAGGQTRVIALGAKEGDELWRHTIELGKGASAHPHPVICRGIVAYEVNERFGRNQYRSRVILLDRESGRQVDVVSHPKIGTRWQRVVYDRGYIAVTVPGELAVYGTRR